MRDIYILLHGQVRVPQVYAKNIQLFNRLKEEKKIKDVIVCTWIGEHPEQIKQHCNFTYLELPKLTDNGHGNWIAQMTNFESAYKYISSISKNPDHTFILKGRPDAYITYDFINYIFSKPLTITNQENSIFKHKIWIPWVEITKPFYFGDELFFGHLQDMGKMYNFNTIYEQHILGQGVTHIRRYIEPFLEQYPILKDYVNNKANISVFILVLNDLTKLKSINKESYEYFIRLLKTYYVILEKYFDIDTKPDKIHFRRWSNYSSNECVNNEESLSKNTSRLCTISKKMICFGKEVLIGNKKVTYNNTFFRNVLNGTYNDTDTVAKDICDMVID